MPYRFVQYYRQQDDDGGGDSATTAVTPLQELQNAADANGVGELFERCQVLFTPLVDRVGPWYNRLAFWLRLEPSDQIILRVDPRGSTRNKGLLFRLYPAYVAVHLGIDETDGLKRINSAFPRLSRPADDSLASEGYFRSLKEVEKAASSIRPTTAPRPRKKAASRTTKQKSSGKRRKSQPKTGRK